MSGSIVPLPCDTCHGKRFLLEPIYWSEIEICGWVEMQCEDCQGRGEVSLEMPIQEREEEK